MPKSLFSNVAEAQKFLRSYSLDSNQNNKEPQIFDRIRDAIFLIKKYSEYQIIGICAEDYEEGIFALQTYCLALGYESPISSIFPTRYNMRRRSSDASTFCLPLV